MSSFLPGDSHLIGLSLLVTIGFQLTCFFCAFVLQVDTLTDLAGSLNFVLLALLSLLLGDARASPRALALTALVVVSRAELGAFLLYRVLRRAKDARFDAVRGNAAAFLVFWVFQMVWVWGVSLPVLWVNFEGARAPPALTAADGVGIALFVGGFALQVVADLTKDAFRADAANRERWCDAGVWAWSRHPNFFGEIVLWWGAFVLAAGSFASPAAAGWATVASPLLTMLILLAGSGMPTAEGAHQRRWMKTPAQAAAFAAYRARTSPLVPLPPALYAALPLAVKRWVLFEWTMYECPPEEDGAKPPAADGGGGGGAAAVVGNPAATAASPLIA